MLDSQSIAKKIDKIKQDTTHKPQRLQDWNQRRVWIDRDLNKVLVRDMTAEECSFAIYEFRTIVQKRPKMLWIYTRELYSAITTRLHFSLQENRSQQRDEQ